MEEVVFGVADMQDFAVISATPASNGSDLDKELMALMLENMNARINSNDRPLRQKAYFQRAKEILFDS